MRSDRRINCCWRTACSNAPSRRSIMASANFCLFLSRKLPQPPAFLTPSNSANSQKRKLRPAMGKRDDLEAKPSPGRSHQPHCRTHPGKCDDVPGGPCQGRWPSQAAGSFPPRSRLHRFLGRPLEIHPGRNKLLPYFSYCPRTPLLHHFGRFGHQGPQRPCPEGQAHCRLACSAPSRSCRTHLPSALGRSEISWGVLHVHSCLGPVGEGGFESC